MTCKGICIRHRALKPQGTGRYADGQKRCQVCQVFLKWENFWCPCCGYRLRTRPRNVKYKSKLIAIRKTSESFLIQCNQSSPVQFIHPIIMISKNRFSNLRKEKGKYAYSTENRIFVWKNIIWPLLLEVNRPWFTLKEYRTKRDEMSHTNHIPKDKIGKGLISLIFKGLVVKEKEIYSIDDNLLPYLKKRIILEYNIAVRETRI